MTATIDLCDRCGKRKARFYISLTQALRPGDRIVIDHLPFPKAGYLCRSCAELLKAKYPGFYSLTEMKKL